MAPTPGYPAMMNGYVCSYHDAWGCDYAVSICNPSSVDPNDDPIMIRNRKAREHYFGFTDSLAALKRKADAIAARSPMVQNIQRVMRRKNDSSFCLRFA